MTLLADAFAARLRQELLRRQADGTNLSVVLLAAPATTGALAALRAQLRVVDAVFAPAPLLVAAILPCTDAAGAQVVTDRAHDLLAAHESVSMTFPPLDAAPPPAGLVDDFAAGGTRWLGDGTGAALVAPAGFLRGYAAHLAAQAVPPQAHAEPIGDGELRAYLAYEVARSRRYGQPFALAIVGATLAAGFDRVLRMVASDTVLGDVFGILEGGRLFVFSYQTAPDAARQLDRALRARFGLAADAAELQVLAFPADAERLDAMLTPPLPARDAAAQPLTDGQGA